MVSCNGVHSSFRPSSFFPISLDTLYCRPGASGFPGPERVRRSRARSDRCGGFLRSWHDNLMKTAETSTTSLRVVEDILDLIGNTPILHLRRLSPPNGAEIYAKLEAFQPGFSVKDRAAL